MIARIVARAAETAKLGFHVDPDMLRHATSYALANEGTDTRLIQDFLGHASIANTVRYTRLAPGRLAAVRVRQGGRPQRPPKCVLRRAGQQPPLEPCDMSSAAPNASGQQPTLPALG
jgi:hypothetical protein